MIVAIHHSIFQITDGQSRRNITPTIAPGKTWPHLIKRPDRLIVSGFDNGYTLTNWELFFLPDGGEWSHRKTPFDPENYGYHRHKWLFVMATYYLFMMVMATILRHRDVI